MLQKREQFIQIIFLHDETLHIMRQFAVQILALQREQISVDLYDLQILHWFESFNFS